MRLQEYIILEQELKPVPINTIKKLGMRIDNPGGDWLEYERERVLKSKKVMGSATGIIRDITLPVKTLSKIKGYNDEHKHVNMQKLEPLLVSIKKNGFDKDNKPLIGVMPNGDVYVLEGNHRIKAADILKLKYIPVEVTYFSGSEMLDSNLSPEILSKIKK